MYLPVTAHHPLPGPCRFPASLFGRVSTQPAHITLALLGSCLALTGADAQPSAGTASPTSRMQIIEDPAHGRWTITEAGRPVLVYNHGTVAAGDVVNQVTEPNLKYARARSDYLHPIHGPNGEVLTKDWALDHPHHRGVYWAWPEVEFAGQPGDLHALQRVFARPTGRCLGSTTPRYALIEAKNHWLWEDLEPIVSESVRIRAWTATAAGRAIDLEFRFLALTKGVTLARRETRLYGGLNLRLAAVHDQIIRCFTTPPGQDPRYAWADLSGLFEGNPNPIGLTILQHPSNPEYPGDWVQYPELNWVQPTFPYAGTRYPLRTDRPLVLRYRLWIHPGRPEPSALKAQWLRYAAWHPDETSP